MTSSSRVAIAALLLAAAAALPGCLSSSELQCVSGTVRCGDTCVATQTDSKNCGSCGSACSGGNVCMAGACVCPVGQGVCGGMCTNLASDPRNCGACGLTCGDQQACNQGICQDCSSGGCQTALMAGCISGLNVGAVRRIQDTPGGLVLEALLNPPGASFPDALGVLGSALLYADSTSASLFEIPLSDLATASSEKKQLAAISFPGTSQLYVEPADGGTRLYAVATAAQSIRIFGGPPAADAGQLLAGGAGSLGLAELGGVPFDPSSYPEPFGKIGNSLFVPLNGTGKVVRVDVSDPANPRVTDTYDLQPLVAALPGGGVVPDGGPYLPSPTQALARNGYVYVAANVLRFYGTTPGADYGPPLVVRIDPSKSGQAAVSAVPGLVTDGGTFACQNVEWLGALSLGTAASPMLVSCAGARTVDKNYEITGVSNTALLLLNGSDQQIAAWVPSTDAGQPLPSVGRAVAQNTTVYVADETASRLYVIDYATNSFVERVGYADGGTPPQVCTSYLSDLKVVPAP